MLAKLGVCNKRIDVRVNIVRKMIISCEAVVECVEQIYIFNTKLADFSG